MRSKYLITIIVLGVVNLILGWKVYAGSPDSPGPPESTSSYTLADLYNRLSAGTTGSQSTFTEPSTAPGTGTMHTLNEIMAVAPVLDNTNGATSTYVLNGQTYWGLTSGEWGTSTGTMANNGAGSTIVPTITNQSVAAGYWSSANTVAGDSDLVAGNIKSGIDLFGVNGSLVEAAIPVQSAVPKTGQTTSYNTGDDGDYQLGTNAVLTPTNSTSGAYLVPSWTGARFTDNGDGTVRDNLTGLIWLKNANCFGGLNWDPALMAANGLADGSCGLSDGSSAGDWRLPNVNELHSLIDLSQNNPALPAGHPFTGVSVDYWSSTSNAAFASNAWSVDLINGGVIDDPKSDEAFNVWPVRGGQ